MRVAIFSNTNEMSVHAAAVLAEQIQSKPTSVLGLATGSTPLATYCELIRMHKEEGLDFSQVTTFNLDEYVGLTPNHRESYHYFMHENLFRHINVPEQNIFIPAGTADDHSAFCQWYEERIRERGGIDLQLLGLGRDGHIGFCEPGSSFSGRTSVVRLATETIEDNARFFFSAREVPRFAVSMGIGTILEARTCLLLATGDPKARAVRNTIEGPITPACPASSLQMHADTVVLLDEHAASSLHECRGASASMDLPQLFAEPLEDVGSRTSRSRLVRP